MSAERNSSAVRNLRSIFETKAGDSSPVTRGRSESGLTSDKENSRPTSRIRASFVSVDPSGGMAGAMEDGVGAGMAELKRHSSAGLRRGSFTATEDSDEGGLLELKKTVSEEAVRREKESNVAEAIPEAAVESAAVTPMVQPSKDHEHEDEAVDESPLAHKEDKEPANPDKPTTAAEEEPAVMKPAEPANEQAVSGGEALPPVAEDLRPNGHKERADDAESAPKTSGETTQAPATKSLESALKSAKKPAAKASPNGKPASISTKSPAKPSSSSIKSPASQPKTPLSAKTSSTSKTESPRSVSTKEPTKSVPNTESPRSVSTNEPTKKASRSSLTAPTAASVARAAGSDRTVSTTSKQSLNSKVKPREGTKAINLPSRLTAPTAASRAKHEPASAAPSTGGFNGRASTMSTSGFNGRGSTMSTSGFNGKASTMSTSGFNGRASTATRPKPSTSSARPTPRSSLAHPARPESRTSHVSKKPAAPASGSFLERMMRPTAASSSKTHEKTEPKSPPRTRKPAPPKAKPNGHITKPAAPKTSSRPSTAKSTGTEKAAVEPTPNDAPAEQATDEPAEALIEVARDAAKKMDVEPPADLPVTHGKAEEDVKEGAPAGNETPIPEANGHHEADGALEATPAAIGGEETIR